MAIKKDLYGVPLELGDIVAFSTGGTTSIIVGRLFKETPQQFRITTNLNDSTCQYGFLKYPRDLVRFTEQYNATKELYPEVFL